MESKYYTDPAIRARVDEFLKLMAAANANLGLNSTDDERAEVQAQLDFYEDRIREVDAVYHKEVFMIDHE